jgi:transposase-like protein
MTHKSEDYKISAVKYYLKNKDNIRKTCKIFDCKKSTLQRWIQRYNSTKNLSRRNRKSISYKLLNNEAVMEIAPWKETKWLVGSSFLFLLPSFYAYNQEKYEFAVLLVFTSIISANYWRKANHSWRRNLDLIFAKVSFICFLVNGIIYVRYVPYMISGYSLLVSVGFCYYFSGKLLTEKNPDWYKYHLFFHIIMIYEQFIILDSMS